MVFYTLLPTYYSVTFWGGTIYRTIKEVKTISYLSSVCVLISDYNKAAKNATKNKKIFNAFPSHDTLTIRISHGQLESV